MFCELLLEYLIIELIIPTPMPISGGFKVIYELIRAIPVDVSGHAKVTNLSHPPRTFAGQKTVPGSNIPVRNTRRRI